MRDEEKFGECVRLGVVTGSERLEGVVACVCAANRAITVARDDSSQAGLRCRELGESLARLAGEREEMRTQLEAVGREGERGERQREEYVAKMAALRRRVSQAEENTSAYQKLARLLAKKQQMEQKSKRVQGLFWEF